MKTIGELQHEFLTNLLRSQRSLIDEAVTTGKINPVVMNAAQASYRLSLFNQYRASIYLNLKG